MIRLLLIFLLIYHIYCFDFDFNFTYPKQVPKFGSEMKQRMFILKPDDYYIQHGSYGAAPIPVIQSQKHFISLLEQNPMEWMMYHAPKYLQITRESIADYVGSNPNNIVMVESATTATNSILRSLVFNKGDKILHMSFEYHMVKNVVSFLKERYQLEVIEVHVKFPTNGEKIVQTVEEALDKHSNIKLAIFDHIVSSTAMIMPVEKLIPICRKRNILVMIDGAHAVGQIPLNLTQLDPDFYFSNCHKWLSTVKGSAFLYVKPSLQHLIYPAQISKYNAGFVENFNWIGTRDMSNYFSVIEALKFRKWIGDEKIYEYNNKLCRNVAYMLFKRWNTDSIVPLDMFASMVLIRIPCNSINPCYTWNINHVLETLIAKYRIWVIINEIDGIRYFRLSCNIYNEMSEYEYFAKRFEEVIQNLNKHTY